MKAIDGHQISYSYDFDGSPESALSGVDISVKQGEFTVILGKNGSGKSTLARHFNGLLSLQSGTLWVAGINAGQKEDIWRLRRLCGMVFQNPDNQFVSPVVEEDIAFGLENYEVPRKAIPGKVKEALRRVGMEGFETRSPHTLSGGQKQRIALAGILALDPELIVFDEATAMLDPQGRREVLDILKTLHTQGKKTIVMISHYVEEALWADTVYLLRDGKVLLRGPVREVLTNREAMMEAGILPPIPVRLYYDLLEKQIPLSRCPLTNEELVEELCRFK